MGFPRKAIKMMLPKMWRKCGESRSYTLKTLENKGEVTIDEIRNRELVGRFHNPLKSHKVP